MGNKKNIPKTSEKNNNHEIDINVNKVINKNSQKKLELASQDKLEKSKNNELNSMDKLDSSVKDKRKTFRKVKQVITSDKDNLEIFNKNNINNSTKHKLNFSNGKEPEPSIGRNLKRSRKSNGKKFANPSQIDLKPSIQFHYDSMLTDALKNESTSLSQKGKSTIPRKKPCSHNNNDIENKITEIQTSNVACNSNSINKINIVEINNQKEDSDEENEKSKISINIDNNGNKNNINTINNNISSKLNNSNKISEMSSVIEANLVQAKKTIDFEENYDSDSDLDDWKTIGLIETDPEGSTEGNMAPLEPLNISIDRQPLKSTHRQKKLRITKEVKEYCALVHKLELIFLLFHGHYRNNWCNSKPLQDYLVRFVPQSIINKINPSNPDIASNLNKTLFLEGLQDLMNFWRRRFRVTKPGLRMGEWSKHIKLNDKNFINFSKRDSPNSTINPMNGSVDLAAQGFCALLRGLGMRARLVFSLQPLPLKPSLEDGSNENNDHKSNAKTTKAKSSSLKNLFDSNQNPDSSINQTLIPEFPVFWVEVWNEFIKGYCALEPIVLNIIENPYYEKKSKFEPPMSNVDNKLRYVIAFDDEGNAKDVTIRYTTYYNSKTIKNRITADKKGSDWWLRLLNIFQDGKISRFTEIEDNYLAKKAQYERLPDNMQDFKNHPIYALKRYLRKNEILAPNTKSCGIYNPRGKRVGGETMYKRCDVITLHSFREWYMRGRVVNTDEVPLKVLKTRPKPNRTSEVTVSKSGIDGENERQNENTEPLHSETPLYSFEQTIEYKPPSILEDGTLPRNKYGSIDIFNLSMIPFGCVYLTDNEFVKTAIIAGIDYVRVVSGFDFSHRSANKKVSPTYNGIIVSEESLKGLLIIHNALSEQERRITEKIKKLEERNRVRKQKLKEHIKERLNREHGRIVRVDKGKSSKEKQDKKFTNETRKEQMTNLGETDMESDVEYNVEDNDEDEMEPYEDEDKYETEEEEEEEEGDGNDNDDDDDNGDDDGDDDDDDDDDDDNDGDDDDDDDDDDDNDDDNDDDDDDDDDSFPFILNVEDFSYCIFNSKRSQEWIRGFIFNCLSDDITGNKNKNYDENAGENQVKSIPSNTSTLDESPEFDKKHSKLSNSVINVSEDEDNGGGFLLEDVSPERLNSSNVSKTDIKDSEMSNSVINVSEDEDNGGGFLVEDVSSERLNSSNVLKTDIKDSEMSNPVINVSEDEDNGGGFLVEDVSPEHLNSSNVSKNDIKDSGMPYNMKGTIKENKNFSHPNNHDNSSLEKTNFETEEVSKKENIGSILTSSSVKSHNNKPSCSPITVYPSNSLHVKANNSVLARESMKNICSSNINLLDHEAGPSRQTEVNKNSENSDISITVENESDPVSLNRTDQINTIDNSDSKTNEHSQNNDLNNPSEKQEDTSGKETFKKVISNKDNSDQESSDIDNLDEESEEDYYLDWI